MGESSEPRRPTHDTNTSRRQVSTHTSTTSTTTTTLQQIQTHYEVYWIDCIYFDASSCCYGFNGFCKVHCISRTSILLQCLNAECESCKQGVSVEEFCRSDPTFPECPTEQPPICCNAYNAKCESCKQGLSEEEFCRIYPTFSGCPTPTPVCCNAYNAECEACKFGITVEEMCRVHEED